MTEEDIVKLAEIWGSEISSNSRKDVKMRCPFVDCGHRAFSIQIAEQTSKCHCFFCKRGGTVKQIAHKLLQESSDDKYVQAFSFVKKTDGGSFDPFKVITDDKAKALKIKRDPALTRIMRVSPKGVSPILRARGITDGDIKKWDLRFDELNQRDLFPMLDYQKRLVAISGRRVFAEQSPKYFHYGGSPDNLTKIYYGEQFIDPTVSEGILVEGPTDTIATSRQFPNVLGQSGAQIVTASRLKRLKRWFRTLTLLYDSDAAGSVGMFRVGLSLFKHFILFIAFLPEGLDPFDASTEQRYEAIKKRTLWSLVDWGSKGVSDQ